MPVTGFLRRPPTSPPDASSRDVLGVPALHPQRGRPDHGDRPTACPAASAGNPLSGQA
jgi:hypothetical protein